MSSCQDKKVVQLPEIIHSDTNEVLDVSPAYLFYDETKPDSLELNRKNLISTTNWLINVDKRLTLEQAIPSIIFLQEKKRNAKMHKNEAAKNYYTCNNTRIKNLGFIEFTDVVFQLDQTAENYLKDKASDHVILNFSQGLNNLDEVILDIDKSALDAIEVLSKETQLLLNFDKTMSFQEYITIKSKLSAIKNPSITINNNEFIY